MIEPLEKFKKNNTCSEITEIDKYYYINKPWCDSSFKLKLKKDKDWSLLSNLILPNELSAIFHKDENLYEFIFSPIEETYAVLSRTFSFNFQHQTFSTYFGKPTDICKQIAQSFRETDNNSIIDTNYRNLNKFRDFYNQDNLPSFVKDFFKDKIPINFFIKGPFNKIENHILLFKYLNIYMQFFDRKSPGILIFDLNTINENYKLPCYTSYNDFPKTISICNMGTTLADLITVANSTNNIRLKYIFYFQVLEYCAYYYMNDDLKRKMSNIIKNPDIIDESEKYTNKIIEEFKNYFKNNDDSSKLGKLIDEFCYVTDIENEIICNKEYFSKDIEFEGGFIIKKLFSPETKDKDILSSQNILKDIKNNIENIRNVLVHVRESRENKVIHPSVKNNNLIKPYLYILRRIAETIAFKYK